MAGVEAEAFKEKLEERIENLAQELAEWLSNSSNGRDRFLMFHTFSNTGWLAYGSILVNLRDRKDLMEKIKGCVVDSGGDPNLDPKVWAAGFTTALLKKNSSAIYPSPDKSTGPQSGNMENGLKTEPKETFSIEPWMLSTFEKLFSYLLNLPFAKEKLLRIVSCLSTDQPHCPQLYLYSSGDKVIPFQAIESFMEQQRRAGKEVWCFNFGPSPHVDHYRTFPDVYTSKLDSFLKKCLSSVASPMPS
ncbi:uncharacterized protein LOC127248482 isoform X2 [Andrographis paniculata]|uniref:uncharacterized protein LOC127248482 isoform X2 n=1 Tax=Andrographis paniculata TaxID=175694 RepID=UPI0021E8D5AE|nr:uncharacterized protein LOC127248482 isoform X2 [Andrographis paniculata]